MESYAVISLESTTEHAVNEKILALINPKSDSAFSFGLNIVVEDRGNNFANAKRVLQKHALQEPFKSPPGVNLDNFNVEVDVYAVRESIGFLYIDCVADALAIFLSKSLETNAMLTIDDFELPLFVYEKGVVTYQSIAEHESFYRSRRWRPTTD